MDFIDLKKITDTVIMTWTVWRTVDALRAAERDRRSPDGWTTGR
jgi:hypothetical protein